MNGIFKAAADWGREIVRGWDRFWFTPQEPHTLALIRILGGAMLLYTHLVWTLDLDSFLGRHSWITNDTVALLNTGPDGNSYAWSLLALSDAPAFIWAVHIAGLVILLMLTLGLFTRASAVLAWIVTISYCHRLTGSLFGLDQINALLATYLMIGASGEVWSLDRWLAKRHGTASRPRPAISTNIAVRLIQLHMCIIYLFGGIGKMRGMEWWDGSAVWFSFANLEYQSLDMTWMVRHAWLIALLTHVTVFWETFYCFLVWPKLTRPICLAMAVAVHGGIALCLGMKTFGLVMIIANLAFVPPEMVVAAVSVLLRPLTQSSPTSDASTPAMTTSLAQTASVRS